ncbi:MAG: YeiH family protein [Syntrophales bacterium]
MSAGRENHWRELWRTEDWLAVWVGFIIIILVLFGLSLKTPVFRWTTEGELASFISKTTPALDKLILTAEEKGEKRLAVQAAAVKVAFVGRDRETIGGAVKSLAGIKDIKDEALRKKTTALSESIAAQVEALPGRVISGGSIRQTVSIGLLYLLVSLAAFTLMGQPALKAIGGFIFVFILTWGALLIAGNYTINYFGLEYVLWCLMIGLLISNVIGVPAWLKPAVRTEFYIKTGLVILGSGIIIGEIVTAGAYGIVQSLLVVGIVWYVCYWLAVKMKVDEKFAAVLSSSVSICGVSAAIAISGAIKGDPKKLSYVTSLVLLCSIPMLVVMPVVSKYFGFSDVVAGAWLGGTLDTSGSVVAAGEMISETAVKAGVIVKMSQNVLIGFVAFILAIVWTFKKAEDVSDGEKPTLMEIWYRFPKFVLGFIILSAAFSFQINQELVAATKGILNGLRTWWFALAFTCIGLDTNIRDITKMDGGRPAAAFLIAQAFNIFWTLLLAWLIFGGVLFPVPKL